MKKITLEQFAGFEADFFGYGKDSSKPPHHTVLRYGQAFCNQFSITDPDLFYEIEIAKSKALIKSRYI